MPADDLAQRDVARDRLGALPDRGLEDLATGPRLRQRRLDDVGEALEVRARERVDERLLRREVAVDRADADARAARDVLDLRVESGLGEAAAAAARTFSRLRRASALSGRGAMVDKRNGPSVRWPATSGTALHLRRAPREHHR